MVFYQQKRKEFSVTWFIHVSRLMIIVKRRNDKPQYIYEFLLLSRFSPSISLTENHFTLKEKAFLFNRKSISLRVEYLYRIKQGMK